MLEKENGQEGGSKQEEILKGNIPLAGIQKGQMFGPIQGAHNSPWVLQANK